MTRANRKSLFGVLDSVQAENLHAVDKLVLVYLAWRQGRNTASWPSLRTIEKNLHFDRRTCLRSIARLCESGCIQKTSGRCGRGHSNHYTIMADKRGRGDTFSDDTKGGTLTPFDERKGGQMTPEKEAGSHLKEQGKEQDTMCARERTITAPAGKTRKRTASKQAYFIPPTVEQVADYAEEKGDPQFEADTFMEHYTSRGWIKVNGKPVANWKATVREWMKRNDARRAERGEPPHNGFSQFNTHPATEEEIAELEKAGVL